MKNLFIFFCIVPNFTFSQNGNFQLDSADVKSIDGIIAALYDVISGEAGKKRNWERFKILFKPEAKLCATGKDAQNNVRFLAMSVEQYIERSGAQLEKNGFFETEIGRKTDTFGLVTQVFSTYQSKMKIDGEVFMRGINSIQLVYDDKRYWIVNILWNNETPKNPIPPKYLIKD